MSTTHANKIDIIKAATSKINEVDFENLSFGSVFTDHLLECDFINGEWQNLLLSLTHHFIRPFCKSFPLWSSHFEGMKAYKDESDDVWLP
jgi:branched-chain amino acid aminotransferase